MDVKAAAEHKPQENTSTLNICSGLNSKATPKELFWSSRHQTMMRVNRACHPLILWATLHQYANVDIGETPISVVMLGPTSFIWQPLSC
jgi:hypothetical protein